MVKTPVLFVTFVRVDYARQVWEAIKTAQPQKLYFYSNKGRENKEGEIERNNEIRSWVNEVDWDCELHTWFREECVDVYTSLRGAVSWLFDNEPEGIIFEDDIVPTKAFFSFCDQMIEKFRDDKRIWYISGDNFLNANPGGYDYIFSFASYLYGWATWRDRWQTINWEDVKLIEDFFLSGLQRHIYKSRKYLREGKKAKAFMKNIYKTKTWDVMFPYTGELNHSMAVIPTRHLITNVGCVGEHSALSKRKAWVYQKAVDGDKDYVIKKEPKFFYPNYEYDFLFQKLQHPFGSGARALIKQILLVLLPPRLYDKIKNKMNN